MDKELSEMTLRELWELFPISLTEHNDRWERDYREMDLRLRALWSDIPVRRISHIGSTAIAGIRAKNIVDVLAETEDAAGLRAAAEKLEQNGFLQMSVSGTRISFNLGYTKHGFAEKVYHIHLRLAGDNDELYFRDYLNEDPAAAKEYEALKLSLWKKFEHDRDGYTGAKTEFVRAVTAKAKKKYPGRYA